MTIHQFAALDELEQIEVFLEGCFIGKKDDDEYHIVCKQIDDFYVEYLMLGDVYKAMRAFKDPDLLQPYLEQMEIDIQD